MSVCPIRSDNRLRSRWKTLGARCTCLLLLLCLGGCKVGPDFERPEAPVSAKWTESDPKLKPEPADLSSWWNVFEDPVLNRLIDTAYRQNLSLRVAGIRTLEAQARLGIAIGLLFPQAQRASATYSRVGLSENSFPTSQLPDAVADQVDRNFDWFRLGFDALWEVDLWGKFRRGIEAGDAQLIATVATYDDVLVTLTAEVANAYVLYRTFEEQITIAQQNVARQQRALEISSTRFEGGATTELDPLQARTLLRNTQALVPLLKAGMREARNALATLVGVTPDQIGSLLGEPGKVPTAPPEVAVGIPSDLLRRRPDVRRAELNAAAQCALIGVAQSELYPALGLSGTIGVSAENASDLFRSGSVAGFISPFVGWKILNYGRLKNAVRVQDARFEELVALYQNTVLAAQAEVENAMARFLRAQEEVGFRTDAVQAATRAVELALSQYSGGTATYTRVINTQQALALQEDLLVQARGRIARSMIAIYKALGGGWQIRQGLDFVPDDVRQKMRERTDWDGFLAPKDQPGKEWHDDDNNDDDSSGKNESAQDKDGDSTEK